VETVVLKHTGTDRLQASSSTKGDSIVFVVDDDRDVREGLQNLLESVGLKSEAFPSTEAFLAAKRPDQASCLILDVRLPGRSGLEFQRELATHQLNIPIIFISGYADIPMTVKAMRSGALEFLTKPLREQDLLDAVRTALDRDRGRRQTDEATRDLRARFATLSEREQQVMRCVCAGLMNKQTAARLEISEITVKVHRHNVMDKLVAKSLPQLVRMADTLGMSCADERRPSNVRAASPAYVRV
jgi:FixJ family two-component response regulator